MQQFSCQPCDNAMYTGQYQIIRWNTLLEQWELMKGEIYATEEAAKQRAKELNQENSQMDIIERIKDWSEIQNRPPVNDQMFYDIVIDTLENQLDEESFLQAITDQDIDVTNVYKRYEDLRNCLLYYRTKLSHEKK